MELPTALAQRCLSAHGLHTNSFLGPATPGGEPFRTITEEETEAAASLHLPKVTRRGQASQFVLPQAGARWGHSSPLAHPHCHLGFPI